MKQVRIAKIARVTRCELYMCGTMATHSIATPDAPPGQCFLLCMDHMKGMQEALKAMSEEAPAVEPVVVPDEPAVVIPDETPPTYVKKRNTFAGDGK